MSKKLKKGLYFTDIHWGRKANSDLHNDDCTRFIKWVCEIVKQRDDIDFIGFLGDWFEHRSAVNISTLNISYQGACLLNELNLPVFFCVGNHDLYHRNTRNVHSLVHYSDLENFIVIDEAVVVDNIVGKVFFCPYMFHHEYATLKEHSKNAKVWAGHFEFKGFVITGTNVRMPTGPDISDFVGPKSILSGHFHKRQKQANIEYIGNTFPMDFGDVNDISRGVAIYNHETNETEYIDWDKGPRYFKFNISDLIENDIEIPSNSYVKCVINIPLSYEELLLIRQTYTEKYHMRDFLTEETSAKQDSLTDTEVEEDVTVTDITSVDDLIIGMLLKIENEQLDNNLLVELYKKL